MADDNLQNQIKAQMEKAPLNPAGEAMPSPENQAAREAEIRQQAAGLGTEMAKTAAIPSVKTPEPTEAGEAGEGQEGRQAGQAQEEEQNPINRVDDQGNKLPGSRKEIHQKQKQQQQGAGIKKAKKKGAKAIAKLLLTGGSGIAGGLASYFIS